MDCNSADTVITDLTVSFCSLVNPKDNCALDPLQWHRIEKQLYLHRSQQSAWLHLAQKEKEDLTTDDSVVIDVKVGVLRPDSTVDGSWDSRPGGIWGTWLTSILFMKAPIGS